MSLTNKQIKNEDLSEILNTLNVIDVSLYDLIQKRIELLSELPKSKFSASDFIKTLTKTLSYITGERKYNKDILSIMINIINITLYKSNEINLYIANPKSYKNNWVNTAINSIESVFPLPKFIRYDFIESNIEGLNIIKTSKNALLLVSAGKTLQKDIWWLSLLTPENKNIGVIGKLPLNNNFENDEFYLLAQAEDFYNFDRSLIVIATSEPITYNWLKSAMHKFNIPLYSLIDSAAIYNGTVLHLIEISSSIKPNDDILKLNESLNGINIRTAGSIGGYSLPLIDKDKILQFKSI